MSEPAPDSHADRPHGPGPGRGDRSSGALPGRADRLAGGAPALRIVVASHAAAMGPETDPEMDERDRALRIGLLEAGCNLVAVLPADLYLAERIRQLQPDVVIVDAKSDARDAVEHVVVATRDDPRPIVLFTDTDDPALAREAIAHGVTAYIVRGLQSNRVQSILDVAMARFQREQALRAELAQAQAQLSDRKTIERAKGLLMKRHGLDEEQAYRRLRRLAMDRGLRLAELARRLIDAADMLG